jgi:hypothetical protein
MNTFSLPKMHQNKTLAYKNKPRTKNEEKELKIRRLGF